MQIDDKDKTWIIRTIRGALPRAKIIFFGSRVKGKAKKYSDLDVAVRHSDKIPLAVLSDLKEKFAASDLPYKIDLVDYLRVSEEFQNLVDRYVDKQHV